MIVRMNENEIKQTIEGLRCLLQTMKGEEFVVSVPLEEDEPPMWRLFSYENTKKASHMHCLLVFVLRL